MAEEFAETRVWRVLGPNFRAFAWMWLPLTSAVLIVTLFVDDAPLGTRLGAVCNVAVGAGFVFGARTKTVADQGGLTITQLRARHVPWHDVEELGTDAAGRWATSMRATLSDGSTVTLPAVPSAELHMLEELRAPSD